MAATNIIAILTIVFASTGFWAFVTKVWENKRKNKSAESRLLMGIAFSKISDLGLKYIERGSITQEEFHDLYHYLYEPYHEMGGNGTAERVMEQVKKLPFKDKD